MMFFESMSFMDALWLTFTSATTVGYGDLYAQTTYGRLATIALLYICGIAILAQVAVMYFDYHQEIRENKLRGDWYWSMKNHIVFLNSPKQMGEEYFYRAISQLRENKSELSNTPIIIVSDLFKDGISNNLRQLNIAHVRKSVGDNEALKAANVEEAHTIIILSQNQIDPASDSINFDLIYRLKAMNVKARIIAEVINDENRERFKKAGANHIIRPIRSYPELLTRTIVAPGSEQIIESLFDHNGAECIRYNLEMKGKWADIIQTLAKNDIGLPIAYEDQNSEIVVNPSVVRTAEMKAIFIIENEGRIQTREELGEILKEYITKS